MAIKIVKNDGWRAVVLIADSLEELNESEQHVDVGEFALVLIDSSTGELYVKQDKNSFVKIQ